MQRVEVQQLHPRSGEDYGEAVVAIELNDVAIDVRLLVPHHGDPIVTVNERLPGGGVRRMITEPVRGRPRPGPYTDHFTNTPEDAAAFERATEGGV